MNAKEAAAITEAWRAWHRPAYQAGDRVRDKRHCCIGTVRQANRESRVGYVLVVDWDGGFTNTQHPDDIEPAPSTLLNPEA